MDSVNKMKSSRGFASMDPARQKEIASKGGKQAHAIGKAHKFTSEEASIAGKKGGLIIGQNREHMATIGRKGGLNSSVRRRIVQAEL